MTLLDTAPSAPHVLMTGTYPEWDMGPLNAAYQIHRLWEADDRQEFVAARADRVRAIATRGELGASAALIAALPQLEMIACYGVGTDAIDLAAARARGIRVSNTPDVLTGDVADIGVGLALALMRRIPAADAYVRSGAWAARSMELVTRVYGKRVGVVGFGRIGMTLARRLSGFDVVLWGSHSGSLDKFELLSPVWQERVEVAARRFGVRYLVVERAFVEPAVLNLDRHCALLMESDGFDLYDLQDGATQT